MAVLDRFHCTAIWGRGGGGSCLEMLPYTVTIFRQVSLNYIQGKVSCCDKGPPNKEALATTRVIAGYTPSESAPLNYGREC